MQRQLLFQHLITIGAMLATACGGNSGAQAPGDTAEPESKPEPQAPLVVLNSPETEIDTDTGPQVVSDEKLAVIPSMPLSQLLGKTRANIETLFHPNEPGHAEGWVRYNEHLEVRYEKQLCVELIQLVPGGLTCRAAARWVGFGETMAPIYRADKCVWPANSLKHLLGQGVSGELVFQGGMFRARLDR